MKERKTLGLFFTRGISVETWFKSGLLDREKIIYEKLIKEKIFDNIYWFSYGSKDCIYEKYLIKGIKIISKPKIFYGRMGDLVYSFLLPFLKKKYLKKCDVYKTNQMDGSWAAVISKKLYKKPLLVRTGYTASQTLLKSSKIIKYFFSELIENFAYKNSDFATVTSKTQKKYIIKNYNPNKIILNTNYVNTKLFKPIFNKKIKDIIFVGRLSEEKNIINLIKAVSKTDYGLDLYGEGSLKNELENLIESLKEEKKIKLMGTIPNDKLPIIMNHYKLFVLPSLYEGMPKTLLEAMSCGLCCIGTNIDGINEVIINNHNGLLIGLNEKDIFNGINFLMMNPQVRKSLGINARKTIEENFSLNKIIENEIKIYKNLI